MNDTAQIHDRLDSEHRRLASLLESLAGGTASHSFVDTGAALSATVEHPADLGDLGTETLERTKELSIVRDLAVQVDEIQRAQERLARGEYGVCEACGEPIAGPRLDAKPAARFCLDDQATIERGA
jgi:RNA polymerase-binding transcription factor DksA